MTRIERKQHVDAWLASGLSWEDYCQDHGLVLSTFRNWIANYAYLSGKTRVSRSRKVDLVPVMIAPPVVTASLELRTPSGLTWSLGSGHTLEWIADLIRRVG